MLVTSAFFFTNNPIKNEKLVISLPTIIYQRTVEIHAPGWLFEEAVWVVRCFAFTWASPLHRT